MARTFASHTTRPAVEVQRKRDLGLIHQGKSALHWSDDDYRYHLKQLTGKTSSKDLDHAARRKVLAHMETLGFKPKSTFKPFDQAAKIRWLWRKLAEAGGVRDAGDAALLAFVGRTAGMGVADLKFLPVAQASTVIEALKAWLDRAKRAQAGTHG
ncbi:regulatory protein GemA [Paracidovorax cattleyae]|uniref:regulatory protein GemA n=1 Tax=Paracidovorax cattleyae TaxID=80868 RepID=UPI0018AF706F|nr:regulatory protein GemA [Paracidovorax cattleyae]MBF9265226.1 regulatory protein GemA [Paracidovorax cattleyae]